MRKGEGKGREERRRNEREGRERERERRREGKGKEIGRENTLSSDKFILNKFKGFIMTIIKMRISVNTDKRVIKLNIEEGRGIISTLKIIIIEGNLHRGTAFIDDAIILSARLSAKEQLNLLDRKPIKRGFFRSTDDAGVVWVKEEREGGNSGANARQNGVGVRGRKQTHARSGEGKNGCFGKVGLQ